MAAVIFSLVLAGIVAKGIGVILIIFAVGLVVGVVLTASVTRASGALASAAPRGDPLKRNFYVVVGWATTKFGRRYVSSRWRGRPSSAGRRGPRRRRS